MSQSAAEITRSSKSNLALAFVALSRKQRRDITTFYAFCRIIDDVVDASALTAAEKQEQLNRWRRSLRASATDEPPLAGELRNLIARYRLTPEMFDDIIAGVEMDLRHVRYATFADLWLYCFRVASAVGLISIEIFGYRNPRCKEYAIQLGLALQLTNIIRDVGKDVKQGRIYLPQEDLDRFDYPTAELECRQYDDRFLALMDFEAKRARDFFAAAQAVLPPEDRRSMIAAEIMGSVYLRLLDRMQRDRFRVFEKEYRLSKLEKAGRVAAHLFRNVLNVRRHASV